MRFASSVSELGISSSSQSLNQEQPSQTTNLVRGLLEVEMKRFDGFTDILYKLFAISESMYYLSRLPYEKFLDANAGTNLLRTVSLINRLSILAVVSAKCCGKLAICEDRLKAILYFWVPFNHLWFLMVDAPFFM